MQVSFYINRKDIEELNDCIQMLNPDLIIETMNLLDVDILSNNSHEFILVTITYEQYKKVKGYLKFINYIFSLFSNLYKI